MVAGSVDVVASGKMYWITPVVPELDEVFSGVATVNTVESSPLAVTV